MMTISYNDRIAAPQEIRNAVLLRWYPTLALVARHLARIAIDQHWGRLSPGGKVAFAERLGVTYDPAGDPDAARETQIGDTALGEILDALQLLEDQIGSEHRDFADRLEAARDELVTLRQSQRRDGRMVTEMQGALDKAKERIASYEKEVATSRRVIAELIGDTSSSEVDRELDAYLETARAIGASTPLSTYFGEAEDDAK